MSYDARGQFLRNRVMTATPAQRVVMLYDRLTLDLTSARQTDDLAGYGQLLGHAMQIVAELRSSLDLAAGGPAGNLAALYTYLMTGLIAARGGERDRLPHLTEVVTTLRDAWAQAAEQVAGAPRDTRHAAGAWVG